ncbi:hypothetical protein F4825DRAFT_447134 [Nemania diffusa]|nr:hypothetical protein F4825DRAFT_447134 [Nemania diffusa]
MVTVMLTPIANCTSWVEDVHYVFEIYNIANWATDSGSKLRNDEKGCGTLIG